MLSRSTADGGVVFVPEQRIVCFSYSAERRNVREEVVSNFSKLSPSTKEELKPVATPEHKEAFCLWLQGHGSTTSLHKAAVIPA